MTIGIYSLYWEEPDLIYIGQSVNIETRFYEHIRLLRTGKHCNYKINSAYSKYGEPNSSILEECCKEQLNELEVSWITEFDSIDAGLNIIPGGICCGRDYMHGAAKHSKEELIYAANLLLDDTLSLLKIKEITKISSPVLSSIANAKKHLWLFELVSEEQMLIASRKRRLVNRSTSPHYGKTLVAPNGNEYSVPDNISEFTRVHNLLNSKINEVLSGKRAQYIGWKLKT